MHESDEPSSSEKPSESISPRIRPNFAVRPIEDAFDWPDFLSEIEFIHGLPLDYALYLVVCRSTASPNTSWEFPDTKALEAELVQKLSSQVLLYYFQGANEDGNELSFYLLNDADEAQRITTVIQGTSQHGLEVEQHKVIRYNDTTYINFAPFPQE